MDSVVILWCCFSNFFFHYQLEEQDSEGQCNSECKTIERACQEVCVYFKFNSHLLSVLLFVTSKFHLLVWFWNWLMWESWIKEQVSLNIYDVVETVHHLKCTSCAGFCICCIFKKSTFEGGILQMFMLRCLWLLDWECGICRLWDIRILMLLNIYIVPSPILIHWAIISAKTLLKHAVPSHPQSLR